MESALIISHSEKGRDFFTELLNASSISRILATKSCIDARKLLLEQSFDLVIVNAPLMDETGESLSRQIASKGTTQVILVLKSEHYEALSTSFENDGVFTIAKPVNKAIFRAALKFANASRNRLMREKAENIKLNQKIEDIRIVDRAKHILISHVNMSEQEAHRFIEKQAMDMRATKRTIAEGILRTYEY